MRDTLRNSKQLPAALSHQLLEGRGIGVLDCVNEVSRHLAARGSWYWEGVPRCRVSQDTSHFVLGHGRTSLEHELVSHTMHCVEVNGMGWVQL
jgi:hypothetical protein